MASISLKSELETVPHILLWNISSLPVNSRYPPAATSPWLFTSLTFDRLVIFLIHKAHLWIVLQLSSYHNLSGLILVHLCEGLSGWPSANSPY